MAKKANKKKGRQSKKTQPSAPEVDSSSSRPSTSRIPTTINNLPDELLDDIALLVDQPSLKSLALVERRFYKPARRQTCWIITNSSNAKRFLNRIDLRPELALLIRDVELKSLGARRGGDKLSGRTMIDIFTKCSCLKVIDINAGVGTERAILEAAATIGRITTLRDRSIARSLHWDGFLAILSSLSILESLCLTLDLTHYSVEHGWQAMADLEAIASCPIASLTLSIKGSLQPTSIILEKVGSFASHLSILWDATQEEESLPSVAEFNTLLQPYIFRVLHFAFYLFSGVEFSSDDGDWDSLQLPPDRGWIRFLGHFSAPPLGISKKQATSFLVAVGSWSFCRQVLDVTVNGKDDTRVLEAKRGRDWTVADRKDAERFMRKRGGVVKWQKFSA